VLRPFDLTAKVDYSFPVFPDAESELKHCYGPDTKENPRKNLFVAMLSFWHDIAARHDIDYALTDGTAIGHQRHPHACFMPWDIDVDWAPKWAC
jgi:hypothetical protein